MHQSIGHVFLNTFVQEDKQLLPFLKPSGCVAIPARLVELLEEQQYRLLVVVQEVGLLPLCHGVLGFLV